MPKRTHRVFRRSHRVTGPSLPPNSVSSLFRNSTLETVFCLFATISGKTLSESKGHSRSSRRVPEYSQSSSQNSKFHSRNTNFHSRNAKSHDLNSTKTTVLGATPGAIPGIDGNPHETFSFARAFSERFFKNWGGAHAPDFTYSWSFLLTVELLCLQSIEVLLRRTFPV